MSENTRFTRQALTIVLPVAAAVLLLASCSKGSNNTYAVSNAGIKVVNLAPDQQSVNMTLSGTALTNSSLAYGGYSTLYLNFSPGTYTVASLTGASTLASTDYVFLSARYYSLFFIGNNNSYRNVIVNDTFGNFITGQGNAYIRYVNAVADTVNNAKVNVTSGTTTVFGDNASFGTVSGFKVVPAGTVNVQVSSTAAADTSGKFVVTQDYAYTLLISGVRGATDPAKKVQIKLLTNGSLSN